MSWPQVAALAKAGVEFGSHSVTHADLPTLPPAERREEIVRSGEELADRLGKPTRSFAAPYGHVNDAVLDDLARTYEVAFGVRLDRASRQDNPVDVPRIEMHYFRNPNHLRDLLEGRDLYFQSRRLLRNVKAAGMNLMSMGRA
jgi:peptidoglycan/xylan/chitin deacetylase (PgdA/CDA1 family)